MRDGRTLTPQARASPAFMTFATNTLQVVKGRTLPQQYQFTHPISTPEIGDYVAWRKSKDLIQYGLLTSLSPYTAILLDTSISSRRTSRTKTNAPYETFITTTDTINPPGVPIVVDILGDTLALWTQPEWVERTLIESNPETEGSSSEGETDVHSDSNNQPPTRARPHTDLSAPPRKTNRPPHARNDTRSPCSENTMSEHAQTETVSESHNTIAPNLSGNLGDITSKTIPELQLTHRSTAGPRALPPINNRPPAKKSTLWHFVRNR